MVKCLSNKFEGSSFFISWIYLFFQLSTFFNEHHHKLAPSMYICFYNTLTMCLILNVSEMLINY
jgi:hypothetical protein